MTALADYLTAAGYTAVPFAKGPTGHLELSARVNGYAARMFLDTGAGRTVFDAARAGRFGLSRLSESRCASGFGGGGMAAGQTRVGQLELGSIVERDLPALLLDLSHVNNALTNGGSEPIDGIVGADILEAREGLIDYRGSQVFLKRMTAGTDSADSRPDRAP